MRWIAYLLGCCMVLSPLVGLADSDDAAVIARIQALYDRPDPAQRAWLEQQAQLPANIDTNFAEFRAEHAPARLAPAPLAHAALRQLEIWERIQELSKGLGALPQAATASREEIEAWRRWLQQSEELPAEIFQAGPQHDWPEILLGLIANKTQEPKWRRPWLQQARSAASLRLMLKQMAIYSDADLLALSLNPTLASHAWRAWAKRANRGDLKAQQRLVAAWGDAEQLTAKAAGLALWPPAVKQAQSLQKASAQGSHHAMLAQLVLLHAHSATKATP